MELYAVVSKSDLNVCIFVSFCQMERGGVTEKVLSPYHVIEHDKCYRFSLG